MQVSKLTFVAFLRDHLRLCCITRGRGLEKKTSNRSKKLGRTDWQPSVPVLYSWKSISRDQYVLQLLQHSFSFFSASTLSLYWPPVRCLFFPLPKASSKREHLKGKILARLKKGAIERVANMFSPGFYIVLFVIPKINGRLWLVLDLQSSPREGSVTWRRLPYLWLSVQKGDWVISVDLTVSCLHVPIRPSSRKFHRFCY